MFIEQLTDYDIEEIADKLIRKHNLRHCKWADHIFEINKTNNEEYVITIARYEEMNLYPYTKEETCEISDFDFKSDYAFLEQPSVTVDYNMIMYKKFGETYLNELKKHLEVKRRSKVNELKKELEENDIKRIDELTR